MTVSYADPHGTSFLLRNTPHESLSLGFLSSITLTSPALFVYSPLQQSDGWCFCKGFSRVRSFVSELVEKRFVLALVCKFNGVATRIFVRNFFGDGTRVAVSSNKLSHDLVTSISATF